MDPERDSRAGDIKSHHFQCYSAVTAAYNKQFTFRQIHCNAFCSENPHQTFEHEPLRVSWSRIDSPDSHRHWHRDQNQLRIQSVSQVGPRRLLIQTMTRWWKGGSCLSVDRTPDKPIDFVSFLFSFSLFLFFYYFLFWFVCVCCKNDDDDIDAINSTTELQKQHSLCNNHNNNNNNENDEENRR